MRSVIRSLWELLAHGGKGQRALAVCAGELQELPGLAPLVAVS